MSAMGVSMRPAERETPDAEIWEVPGRLSHDDLWIQVGFEIGLSIHEEEESWR
jgi:hypothetical protein